MENKDLKEFLIDKENAGLAENQETEKSEGYANNVIESVKQTESEKVEEPKDEKNLISSAGLENSPGKIQVFVGSEYGYTVGLANSSYPEISMISKHLMFMLVGMMILVNFFTLCILYDRSNMKSSYIYFKAPFFMSYFFYILTIMGSIMLLVYPQKYMKYSNLKIIILAFFFILCFYIAAGVDLSISEPTQVFITQLYVSRFFIIGLLVIITYAFDISKNKSIFFGITFAALESYLYVDPMNNYYEYTVRSVVFVIINTNFVMLIKDYNLLKDSKFPNNQFMFIVFSLSLVANGGVLNFIYDLSLQLLVGKF